MDGLTLVAIDGDDTPLHTWQITDRHSATTWDRVGELFQEPGVVHVWIEQDGCRTLGIDRRQFDEDRGWTPNFGRQR